MAEKLRRRGIELHRAVLSHFIRTEDTPTHTNISINTITFNNNNNINNNNTNSQSTPVQIYRSLVLPDPTSSTQTPVPDATPDASTFALYFLGMLGAPASSSPFVQIPPIKTELAQRHYALMMEKLAPEKKDGCVNTFFWGFCLYI